MGNCLSWVLQLLENASYSHLPVLHLSLREVPLLHCFPEPLWPDVYEAVEGRCSPAQLCTPGWTNLPLSFAWKAAYRVAKMTCPRFISSVVHNMKFAEVMPRIWQYWPEWDPQFIWPQKGISLFPSFYDSFLFLLPSLSLSVTYVCIYIKYFIIINENICKAFHTTVGTYRILTTCQSVHYELCIHSHLFSWT